MCSSTGSRKGCMPTSSQRLLWSVATTPLSSPPRSSPALCHAQLHARHARLAAVLDRSEPGDLLAPVRRLDGALRRVVPGDAGDHFLTRPLGALLCDWLHLSPGDLHHAAPTVGHEFVRLLHRALPRWALCPRLDALAHPNLPAGAGVSVPAVDIALLYGALATCSARPSLAGPGLRLGLRPTLPLPARLHDHPAAADQVDRVRHAGGYALGCL